MRAVVDRQLGEQALVGFGIEFGRSGGAVNAVDALWRVVGTDDPALSLQSGELPYILPREFQSHSCAEAIRFFYNQDSEMVECSEYRRHLVLGVEPGASASLDQAQRIRR